MPISVPECVHTAKRRTLFANGKFSAPTFFEIFERVRIRKSISLVIRALFDKADGGSHENDENFGNIACDHSGRIILKMLESFEK